MTTIAWVTIAEGAGPAATQPPVPPRSAAIRSTRRASPDAGRRDATTFSALLNEVRDAGLLTKRPRYYLVVAAVNSALGAAAIAALVLLGPSLWQLADAAVLGLVLAQFGFLAHEAAHRQVFASGPANDRAARIIGPAIVGLGYTWWQQSHNRHHANPNVVGKDPSVEPQAFVFRPQDLADRSTVGRAFSRVQGYLILPLLLLEGINLHAQSLRALVTTRPDRDRGIELVLVVVRLTALPVLVFTVLPPELAAGFLAVQLGVFGLYLGGAFVPNHVGMPMLERAHGLDYLRKQVLTSRNLTGGALASTLTGGLSLQIEHHLFPGMARPNLLKARPIVLAHCRALGIPYTETSTPKAWTRVIRYLNQVGTSPRSSFRCPVIEDCGRS